MTQNRHMLVTFSPSRLFYEIRYSRITSTKVTATLGDTFRASFINLTVHKYQSLDCSCYVSVLAAETLVYAHSPDL